ncbi:CapA family protein (plasmid) [Sinorhizobium meliloti]|nr:CapA family protein [Sinorhizobium meliloti]
MKSDSQEIKNQVRSHDEYDAIGSIATNVADGFTMVTVGDLIVSRAVTKGNHPGFSDLVEILRAGDATFGNLETNILDIRSFKGSPQAEYGGAYLISVPELAPDLKEMGFNLVGYANNHTFDWGVEGMRETSRLLTQNGIIYAGVGGKSRTSWCGTLLGNCTRARGIVVICDFVHAYVSGVRPLPEKLQAGRGSTRFA